MRNYGTKKTGKGYAPAFILTQNRHAKEHEFYVSQHGILLQPVAFIPVFGYFNC